MKRILLIILCVLLLTPGIASSACVSSIAGIESAASALDGVGGTIEICNGTYDDFSTSQDQNSRIDIEESGANDSNRIFIQAQTTGSVIFTGNFHIYITGDYVTLRNIVWHDNDSYNPGTVIYGLIKFEGAYGNVENCNFYNIGTAASKTYGYAIYYPYGTGGDHGEVSYSSFDTWYNGKMIWAHNTDVNIHHNYFTNNRSDDGDSAMQPGTEAYPNLTQNGTIQYNYFYKVRSDPEVISNKSSFNTYQYNVFDQGNSLTLRNGHDNTVDNNYFLSTYGTHALRIWGANEVVINNYFNEWRSGYAAINVGSGGGDYSVTEDTLIANNTGRAHSTGETFIQFGPASTTPPDNVTLKNNYSDIGIAGSYSFRYYTGTNMNYYTNLCNNEGVANYDNVSNSYCTNRITSSTLSSDGYVYRLTSAGTNGTADASVTLDFDGETRSNPPDIGADEYIDGTAINYIQPSQVGYNAEIVYNVSPPNGATDVNISATATWNSGYSTDDVFLKKASCPANCDTLVSDDDADNSYSMSLDENSTYCLGFKADGGIYDCQEFEFTTTDVIPPTTGLAPAVITSGGSPAVITSGGAPVVVGQ